MENSKNPRKYFNVNDTSGLDAVSRKPDSAMRSGQVSGFWVGIVTSSQKMWL